jgi:hypothetical protein
MSKELIEKGKAYAQQQGRSLSEIVAAYLKQITEKADADVAPLVEEMTGVVSLDDDRDYKDVYAEELAKKYG